MWVIILALPTDLYRPGDKIIDVAIASGSPFSQLNLIIDAFMDAVSNWLNASRYSWAYQTLFFIIIEAIQYNYEGSGLQSHFHGF